MQVNNINNISFDGGFKFQNMPKAAKEALPEIGGKGKQIFYGYEKPRTVFLVTRDCLDARVLSFIKKHNLKGEYYPNINTKAGLDSEIHAGLAEELKKHNPVNFEEAEDIIESRIESKAYKHREYLVQRKANRLALKQAVQEKRARFIDNILENIPYILEKDKVTVSDKGVTVVEDISRKRRMLVTPPTSEHVHLVVVESTSSDFMRDRFAVKSDGTIVKHYSDIDEIKPFNQRFKDILAQYAKKDMPANI